MTSLAIFGVGSPFGQDCVAELVIEKLKANRSLADQVQMEYYDRPGIFLLERMKNYSTVHLIDAIVSDKPTGHIHHYENLDAFQKNCQTLSTHGFGLAETLQLGSVLDALPKKMIIHGIEIDPSMQVDRLPDTIIQACNTLTERIICNMVRMNGNT